MRLPENRITKELTQGLFKPEYVMRDVNLNDAIQIVNNEKLKEDANKKITNQLNGPVINTAFNANSNRIPIPLTEAEAEEADRQIKRVLERIIATRNKINDLRNNIDSEIEAELNGKELSFIMDISKKPRIRRAIKKLFGEKTNTITYAMYKEMLAAKTQLEKDEIADYAKGKTKPDDEDSEEKQDKDKSKTKNGFLKQGANQDEGDAEADLEEQYEKMHPKIGRDFLSIEDAKEVFRQLMTGVDPLGLIPIEVDNSNARIKSREYKELVESGKDNKHFRKQDLVKIDSSEEEE